MTTSRIVLDVAVNLLVAYKCWLLIFRTHIVVREAHGKYQWNFFLKPWYSIFLRCIALFVLLLIVVADYALLTVR
jgi:hypothetical protein